MIKTNAITHLERLSGESWSENEAAPRRGKSAEDQGVNGFTELEISTAGLPDKGKGNADNKSVEDCLSFWCGLRFFDKNFRWDKSKCFRETINICVEF